ncbi:type ISP restriction/modification enzyme [Roseomonas mucosa]|uniref:type ISP restriction/modification enzyme n=1 Tax=Roseomonas mucosa TaxID=207340 RepID=UPI003850E486
MSDFRKAVEQFKHDLPAVLDALRDKISAAYKSNRKFSARALAFLSHARNTINPAVTEADVREMLIQHILTEEIFAHVFNESDFHRQNNIASQLYSLEGEFFKGPVKRNTLKGLEPYYATIRSAAALITSHTEKQRFLKVIYENFYKVYDPKKADKLGVVYTPNDIVRFMIDSADWLTQKHFGKALIDRGVEILDPAAGTGTFVCELLEHFRGDPKKLTWKYINELHANEVAILPYYVANLNIEATYSQITGKYVEFPSLCFVDTLDNISGLGIRRGHQHDLLAALSDENIERVKRQNRAKISVVIGNPPYYANQQSESDNNKSRAYPHIDELIKQSYIKESSAQKTKLYDMYARFFRWATDRLGDDGVIAFVTNNSFVKKANYDGFRKIAAEQFCDIYIIDFKGDARTSGEVRRREGDNIFENAIKVGVAVSFLVRKSATRDCTIHYAEVPDFAKLEEKQAFIAGKTLNDIALLTVSPDAKHSWTGFAENSWDAFPPVASKTTRAAKNDSQARAIFRTYALGVSTNRDEWLYDLSHARVLAKAEALVKAYDQVPPNAVSLPDTVKWSRNLKRRHQQARSESFNPRLVRRANYRPFVPRWLYQSSLFIDEPGGLETFFPLGRPNEAICFSDVGSRTGTCILAINGPADLHFGAAIDAYQQLPRYRYSSSGDQSDNITDWALRLFEKMYGKQGTLDPKRFATSDDTPAPPRGAKGSVSRATGGRKLTKDSIFHYVYAVLYDPVYRQTYALNLRRDFPRIPFYCDFWQWVDWGSRLVALHTGYETVEPWPLERREKAVRPGAPKNVSPKVLLSADKAFGVVHLDSQTDLAGIPAEVWEYRLGNRCGVEWVLEQFKERRPKDPVLATSFDSYCFADHKDQVIELLAKVTRVSVETVKISEDMKSLPR